MNTYPSRNRLPSLLTLAMLSACSGDEAVTNSHVNTYTISREDLPINVKEGGELVAVNETVVRSEVEGNATILSLIPEGTRVDKGKLLVELDVSELIDKRANQEITVEKARNALEQAKTQQAILESELTTKMQTAESQRRIAEMELQKLLGAEDGEGSEGKNRDMLNRLQELVQPVDEPEADAAAGDDSAPSSRTLVTQVHPQNYAGLIPKVIDLLTVRDNEGRPLGGDPLERDMGEMANKILQQADQIRLAMADLKVKEDTASHSRRLAKKQFITRNELERDELAYQSQASKVTIAWNDLELLINYTLERDKIEMRQNLANATLEVQRVKASNDAERKNSQFDVDAKQKEFEVAEERLANLNTQIKNAVIYSPGEGLVVYSKVSRGRGDSEPVEEGTSVRQRQSIIILPDNSKLRCEIKVQEAMIDKVKVGMAAHISAEVRPNEVLTGRVVYVAPVADSQSRWSGNDKKVYSTHVLLDGINTDESLKAGMKASATITVDSVEQVLTVPIQAVRRDRMVTYVWKQTPSGPQAVIVEIGANNQEKVEVKSGLAEGDVVFRTPPGGQADPKFDQPTMPEPTEPAPSAQAVAATRGGSDSVPGDASSRRGDRSRRDGRSRKKFAEMSADELRERKESLLSMPERMGSRGMPESVVTRMNKFVGEVVEAIDKKDLDKAQKLYDTGMRQMRSGMRRGKGAGGD